MTAYDSKENISYHPLNPLATLMVLIRSFLKYLVHKTPNLTQNFSVLEQRQRGLLSLLSDPNSLFVESLFLTITHNIPEVTVENLTEALMFQSLIS